VFFASEHREAPKSSQLELRKLHPFSAIIFFPAFDLGPKDENRNSNMPQSLVAEQLGPIGDFKSYSCLTCRQRKVKCDRRTPCSNCVKAEKQCSFIPPVRGKRRRTKAPREGLHAKLKRYEKLLKSYGAKVEPSEDFDDSDSETASLPTVEMDDDAEPRSKSRSNLFKLEEANPKLITKGGTSRYFERYVCY
jgi:hypothetical protein